MMSNMRRAVLLLTAAVVLATAAAMAFQPPPAGAADPPEKKVEAVKIFRTAENPADPGNCVTTLIAEFKEIRNYAAIGWTTTIHNETGTTREISGAINAPYDDLFTFGAIRWSAPKFRHWAVVGKSWADGPPGKDHCATVAAKYPKIFPAPIVVTYRSYEGKATLSGRIVPVFAWRTVTSDGKRSKDNRELLPRAESTALLSGLTVVAKGPKKTFTAPVQIDGGVEGFYTMEIPGEYTGVYTVSVKAPKGVAVTSWKGQYDPSGIEPAGTATQRVRIKPGFDDRVYWETAYDCDVPPPGMGFAPRADFYSNERFELEWQCRSRRGRLGIWVEMLPGYDPDRFGEYLCPGFTPLKPFPLLLESSTMTLLSGGKLTPGEFIWHEWVDTTFEGFFVSATRFKAEAHSKRCKWDVARTLVAGKRR